MGEEDFGATLGKQWSEGQDTRSQLGTGDTIIWVEAYPQDFVIEPVNIVSKRVYAGSTFTVGIHLLGSQHKYNTTARLNLGSFTDGVEEASGSIVMSTGSSTGSWISPRLRYSETENYDVDGVVTDSGSTTWRHLIYDYAGSVIVNLIDYPTNGKAGSFAATGSDDLENNVDIYAGSDMRIMFDLGSPTSWVSAIFQSFKPALLGSTLTEAAGRLSESRIYQTYTEDFTGTGSIDTGITTGSTDAGSLILFPNAIAQSLSLSDSWQLSNFDRFTLNATGSNLVGSVNFYVSSDGVDTFTQVKRGIESKSTTIGSKVKWKAEYMRTSGSSIVDTIGLVFKSDDY